MPTATNGHNPAIESAIDRAARPRPFPAIRLSVTGDPVDLPPDKDLSFLVERSAGAANCLIFDEGVGAWRPLALPAGTWMLGRQRPRLWKPGDPQ